MWNVLPLGRGRLALAVFQFPVFVVNQANLQLAPAIDRRTVHCYFLAWGMVQC